MYTLMTSRCFPEATEVNWAWDALEMSRSRELIWISYLGPDSTNTRRIVSRDGSVDHILREGDFNTDIEFLPDDSGAIVIEGRALFLFNFETGIETELSSGLPPNMGHYLYRWKLHPDGVQIDSRLWARQQDSGLMVINNVAGLFDWVK
jgi:hypothetical protein